MRFSSTKITKPLLCSSSPRCTFCGGALSIRSASGRKRLSEGRRIAVMVELYYRRNGRLLGLGLFCYLQRVIDFDSEIPHRALDPMDCSP
jgi:hypothetical protein